MTEFDDATLAPAVLLVDDTPANLLALEAVLGSLNAQLVAVRSGKDALGCVEHQTFAVALVDVHMPGMDGLELIRHMRATRRGREMAILLVTADHSDENLVREGYALGAADYITKPYDPQVIRARVKAFIDLYRQRETVRRGQVALRTHERDEAIRRLMAFERIANAVLETNDLQSLLVELLGAFIGAADAADSATILLRDGEWLRLAASVGAAPHARGTVETRIGEGFAGLIANERRALEITDQECDQEINVLSSPTPSSKVRALYGIPLLHAGQVLGVAHIGSTRAGSFTPSEKRLLSAAAERASLAVAKQLELSLLNEVLESAPAYIAIVSASTGEYSFANTPMRQLFQSDLVGTPVAARGFGAEALDAIERARTSGKIVEVSELHNCGEQNGEAVGLPAYVRFTAHPLRNVSGMVERVLVYAIDIALQVQGRIAIEQGQIAHKKLLETERVARRAAELACTAKDEFLAIVSHELRTPLNAILGWAAIARTRAHADKDRALAVIERNARAQARIVEDVLDFSRMSKGKMHLSLRSIVLRELIDSALESVRPAADAKNVSINLYLQLPSPVVGDADRLQQVIWNLLSNAVKFSSPGGTVEVRASCNEAKTNLTVTDCGQGIDIDFLPYVFEPFRQANGSTTRRYGGLGLGLAIVRQIIHAHGGTIEAQSEGLGSGATFVVELPLYETRPIRPTAKSCPEVPHPRASRPEIALDGLKVLVIDDDEDSRELLEEALHACGAEPIVTSSAGEAMNVFDHCCPDVLVSDLAMPDIDGYEFMRRVRELPIERGGNTPALALTAHTGQEALERALAAGFQRYAAKPVDLEWFLSAIAELATHRS